MTRETMLAGRLHGPRDLRVERVVRPGEPPPGQALIRVKALGICGSDLHTYRHARIGETVLEAPLIIGHEFGGTVEAVGEGALDGSFEPLRPGTRVAVDPAQPCGRCEMCERGSPNLCFRLRFCGLWPDEGALCQWMHVPARTCFPVPDEIDDEVAALLEPLGVAIHAVDLARIRPGESAAILGAGPIGLCLLLVARLAGACPILVTDRLPPRLEAARRLGADAAIHAEERDPVRAVLDAAGRRGVDAVLEAAWSGDTIRQGAEMLAPGGRLAVVGISGDDRLEFPHGIARRKELSIVMVRRMKHMYPRAIPLVRRGALDLRALVSHRFPLERSPEAFALNEAYRDGALKVMVGI